MGCVHLLLFGNEPAGEFLFLRRGCDQTVKDRCTDCLQDVPIFGTRTQPQCSQPIAGEMDVLRAQGKLIVMDALAEHPIVDGNAADKQSCLAEWRQQGIKT